MNETNKERLKRLEQRVDAIQAQIQRLQAEPVCPLCSSRSTSSTRFPRRFCRNEYGYCGVLILHGWNGSLPGQTEHRHAYYSRTSWRTDTGELSIPRPLGKPEVEIYFVAGEQVSKDWYLGDFPIER